MGREESGGDQTDSLEGGELDGDDNVSDLPNTPDLLKWVKYIVLIDIPTKLSARRNSFDVEMSHCATPSGNMRHRGLTSKKKKQLFAQTLLKND